jgi:hypothetical protein
MEVLGNRTLMKRIILKLILNALRGSELDVAGSKQ